MGGKYEFWGFWDQKILKRSRKLNNKSNIKIKNINFNRNEFSYASYISIYF